MRKSLLVLLFLFLIKGAKAQDIIIKNDKSEIKAVVEEINDEVVKYRKFEFQDGPLYHIYKAEVFMIIYKNGFRETFSDESKSEVAQKADESKTTQPTEASQSGNSQTVKSESNSSATLNQASNTTASENKAEPKEKPKNAQTGLGRFTTDLKSPGYDVFSLRLDTDYPVFRRNIYVGLSYTVSTYLGEESDTYSSLGLTTSFHLPLNGMFDGDKTRTLKGIDPFIRGGFYTNFSYLDLAYDLGVDLLFINRKKVNGSWGLTVFSTEFQTINLGIALTM